MGEQSEFLEHAAARLEAEAQQMSRRADRAQLLNIADECRAFARHLAETDESQLSPPARERRSFQP